MKTIPTSIKLSLAKREKKMGLEKSWKTHEFQPMSEGSNGGYGGSGLSEGDAEFLLPANSRIEA